MKLSLIEQCRELVSLWRVMAQPQREPDDAEANEWLLYCAANLEAALAQQAQPLTDESENDFGAAEWERIYKAPATNDGYREASKKYAERYPNAPSSTAFSAGMTAGSNLRRILMMRGDRDRMAQQAQPEPMKADRLTLGNTIANYMPEPLGVGVLPFHLAQVILERYDVTVKRETIEREIDAINNGA